MNEKAACLRSRLRFASNISAPCHECVVRLEAAESDAWEEAPARILSSILDAA